MQTNQITGKVPHRPRHSHAENAIATRRATPESRAERISAEESRRPAPQPTARKPGVYGAGF